MASGTVLTVSLNAAVDVSYIVDRFALNQVHTAKSVAKVAGGKANNVARVLSVLRQPVIATGFAGGSTGQFIQEDLRRQGIHAEFAESPGESRTCITIVDPAGQTLTEVRGRGPELSASDADRFLARYARMLARADLVVISGSLPPGIAPDYYGLLVRTAFRTYQLRTILDASGPALAAALPAQPYMLKPNLAELEEWVGRRLESDEAILAAAREMMDAGPLTVTVSLGARGLLLVSPEGVWRATPPKVEAANTTGSGDSLVAGFAAGLQRGFGPEEILRLAVACGTANALTNEVATVWPQDVERLRTQVKVERIS